MGIPDDCILFLRGEYFYDSDAIFWFSVLGDYPEDYVSIACEKRADGTYKFMDTLDVMTYAEDIVHVLWKGEDLFLVNNKDCAAIVYLDGSRQIVREDPLPHVGAPYVFRLVMPTNPGSAMFVYYLR